MKFTAILFVGTCFAVAQQAAPPAAKNLKVLPPDADLMDTMQFFNAALGVQCTFCHVQGDFASDANPRKETARKMIGMLKQIDAYFSTASAPFPRGYHEVDCMTCHRGKTATEPKPARHFLNRGDASGRVPARDPATKLKVLPPGTEVHGAGTIMEEFRDALSVDCAYCHGGTGGFPADDNPRKEIARKMILMVREINANFPGTGTFPAGPRAVDCNTCHRGEVHLMALGNKHYNTAPEAR